LAIGNDLTRRYRVTVLTSSGVACVLGLVTNVLPVAGISEFLHSRYREVVLTS
jgi:hypothetical protein